MDNMESCLLQTLDEITKKKEFLVTALNVLEEGIHIVDSKGKTIFYSKGLEKIEHSKSNQVVGKHISEAYMLDEESSILLKVLKTGLAIKNYETTYMTSKGKTISITTNTYPIYDKGHIVAAISVNKDITKHKTMTETIYKLQKQLYSQQQNYKNGTQYTFSDIIGESKALQKSLQIAKAVAANMSPVLIIGETGTGKELFAQSIHNASPRLNGPFVAVNCAAIPETLLESIIFGTVKGAFTGAENKPGLFEEADKGTLFLDELDSMNMLLQSKLLRVLERKAIRRVGGNKEIPVNPRIISAVSMDPMEAISKDLLRRDLYYRLAVVTIIVPPLQDRTDDIPHLTRYFIYHANKIMKKNVKSVADDVYQNFKQHSWPGNVRELKNAIEYAMNLVDPRESILRLNHIQPQIQEKLAHPLPHFELTDGQDLKTVLLKVEQEVIDRALKNHEGNISRAAQHLGISRQHLQYRVKKLKL